MSLKCTLRIRPFFSFRYAFREVLERLEWKNVASITEHGDKYGSYINKLREILEKDKVTFYKREFQRDAKNVTTVCNFSHPECCTALFI